MRFREFFDRISIINLPERTDRRAEMLEELATAGLSPQPGRIEFFPAVKVADAAGFDNAGYHGCFRSHLSVMQQALAANASNLLVFEDDAAIAKRFKQEEEALVDWLRAREWGLIFFGHQLEGPADRPTELKPHHGGVQQTHFYAVNGKYLARLVDFLDKMLTRPPGHLDGGPMSPDGALHLFLVKNPDVPCHVAHPNLATQRSSRSDLSPKWFDRVPVLSGAIAALRRVKRRLKRK